MRQVVGWTYRSSFARRAASQIKDFESDEGQKPNGVTSTRRTDPNQIQTTLA